MSVQQLTMKGSLLPLFSDKPTRTKGTAINSHWIHCELQTFKRNKNKHVLRTNWLLNPQLRSLVFSVIRNTLTQLAEFGLHTKSARYARRKRKTVDLGARLRKPSKAVTDLLGNHEGDIPGDGSRSIRLRGLGVVLCKQAKTVKNLLAYTRKPRKP